MKTALELFSFLGHKGCVNSILVNEKEPFLITGGRDQTLKFWDLRCNKCLFSIYFEKQSIKSIKKKNGSSSFFLLLNNSMMNLYTNYFEYPEISQKKKYNINYSCFDISTKGTIIIGTELGEFLQFNSNNLQFINKFFSPKQKGILKNEKTISCLIFTNSSDIFLSGGCDRSIKLWFCY
mmetsp:Transcript_18930/g.36377  ORF Transcript_18930/g.36377 Transcript_18930/m.36377 type:complete len:179 (+) Transcript_18930:457-993(+)